MIPRAAFALALAALLLPGLAHARIHRSHAAITAFKTGHPCPATGARRGPCPGWQIDHAIPLKCGGADDPDNMQWLTVSDHAAKTAREAHLCRHHP